MADIIHEQPDSWGPRFNMPEQRTTYFGETLPNYRAETKFKLSVAPGGYFKTSQGVVRKPGERVDDADFGPFLALKNRAVSSGALVELSQDEWDLVNMKGPRKVVLVPHTRNLGISDIGATPLPEHYDRPGRPARQVVRDGAVVPAPEEPGVDGEERIRELIKMRFIAEFKSRQAVQEAIKKARVDYFESLRRR